MCKCWTLRRSLRFLSFASAALPQHLKLDVLPVHTWFTLLGDHLVLLEDEM